MPSQPPAPLATDVFGDVVRLTPLVSIDLIVTNPSGQALVGLRRNPPAKGSWFVPGGRIRKDETLAAAWDRITLGELGLSVAFASADFAGVFEHRYPDNFLGNADFTTHYVVLAHHIRIGHGVQVAVDDQHDQFRWMDPDALVADRDVHEYTKAYFRLGARTPWPVAVHA